jgi:hypothetical protein
MPLAPENESSLHHSSHTLDLLSRAKFRRILPCCANISVFDVTLSTIKGDQTFQLGLVLSCRLEIKHLGEANRFFTIPALRIEIRLS